MNTFKVTRNIPCPVRTRDGYNMKSKYQIRPAIITVRAWKAAEAAAYADEVQANTKEQVWGLDKGGRKPTPWKNPELDWVEVPYEAGDILELR